MLFILCLDKRTTCLQQHGVIQRIFTVDGLSLHSRRGNLLSPQNMCFQLQFEQSPIWTLMGPAGHTCLSPGPIATALSWGGLRGGCWGWEQCFPWKVGGLTETPPEGPWSECHAGSAHGCSMPDLSSHAGFEEKCSIVDSEPRQFISPSLHCLGANELLCRFSLSLGWIQWAVTQHPSDLWA